MAALGGQAPDPKTFKVWDDAFKYPIPAVRRFQQQLRGDITSNRERLRSLVGGSYRDLLGTADAIIQMDEEMKEVEVHLGDTSRRCNTDRLNRSFRNASTLLQHQDSDDKDTLFIASQLAVLQACPDVLKRVLRKDGSVLLAAKVLVIARRLYRTLSETAHVANYTERIWSRISGLRQKLLRMMDRRLINPKTDENGLIDALCAYALATSSASATDLLRHFHRIRLDALSSSSRTRGHHESVLSNLRLWIRTLQDTRAIFQKPLAVSLAKLKSGPVLMDAEVQGVSEFNLEAHEVWLGDDIRNFTPYLRHDDLAVSAAAQQLSSWAPEALKALLGNLQQNLSPIDDFKEVVQIRQDCLELLFSHYHIAGVRKDVVLNGFREAFEEKLQQLVEKRCNGLEGVTSTVEQILQNASSKESFGIPGSLWSDSVLHIETSRGVEDFTSVVHDTLRGLTSTVRIVTDRYRSWLEDIEVVDEVVTTMRNTKWEDHLEDLDSDSESEADGGSETATKQIQSLLKEDDPKALQRALSTHLSAAFKAFTTSFEKLTPDAESQHAQAQAAFLLRIIREVKQHLPAHTPASTISLASAHRLHTVLAEPPVSAAIGKHEKGIRQSLRRKSPAGSALWDGTPPLPNMPSPWVFHLLQDLEGALAEVGTDLWTSDAVSALKGALADQLLPVLQGDAGAENGDEVGGVESSSADTEGAKTEGAKEKGAQDESTTKEGAEVEGAKEEGAEVEGAKEEGAEAKGADEQHEGEQEKGASDIEQGATTDQRPPTGPEANTGMSPDTAKQLLFDLSFLACMSIEDPDTAKGANGTKPADITKGVEGAKGAVEGGQSAAAQELRAQALARADADAEQAGQIAAAAREYRKRTALLFPLAN